MRTNLIPFNSLITLADAEANHSLKRSLETNIKTIQTKRTQIFLHQKGWRCHNCHLNFGRQQGSWSAPLCHSLFSFVSVSSLISLFLFLCVIMFGNYFQLVFTVFFKMIALMHQCPGNGGKVCDRFLPSMNKNPHSLQRSVMKY